MKYFKLSVYAMIFAAFMMKVARLVHGKKQPASMKAPNGLTPDVWSCAMEHAKIQRAAELVLGFTGQGGSMTTEFVIGPSLGNTADRILAKWCWANLVPKDDCYLTEVTTRLKPLGKTGKSPIAAWPLSLYKLVELSNAYNALLRQAERREHEK